MMCGDVHKLQLWPGMKSAKLYALRLKNKLFPQAYHENTMKKLVANFMRTSAERGDRGTWVDFPCRVVCTWWLLGLTAKGPWLGPGGPPPDLTA